MGWRSPPSVKAALSEATRRWPKRSKLSDGTIGDTAHSHRKSDHNPAADGDIHAFDLTHDPANGVDCNLLTAHLVKRRDKRVKYIIWNSKICNAKDWVWKAYTGTNKHTKHMHVSIHDTTVAENDTSDWFQLERTKFTNVAIYYVKPTGDKDEDFAFYRAAFQWGKENQPCKLYKVTTGRDFKQTWLKIAKQCQKEHSGIKKMAIFSHASKGETLDGVEFMSTRDGDGNVVEDGTITPAEIQQLAILPWHSRGMLTLNSCNSANWGSRGWCPAQEFWKRQNVDTTGMRGYSYFSKRMDVCEPISAQDTKIYLWAFQRGKNVAKPKAAVIYAAEKMGQYIAAKMPGKVIKKHHWLPPNQVEPTVVK